MIKVTPHNTILQIIAPPNSNNHFKNISTLLNPIKAYQQKISICVFLALLRNAFLNNAQLEELKMNEFNLNFSVFSRHISFTLRKYKIDIKTGKNEFQKQNVRILVVHK